MLHNDYDKICKAVHDYMQGVRLPCKYCNKLFLTKESCKTHYKVIHRIIQYIYMVMKYCTTCRRITEHYVFGSELLCTVCL